MQNQYKNYRISIIIPNYNGERFIGGCLESICSQNYKNYEVIIVDGKSTDQSHIIIASYVQMYPDTIKWLNVIDTGISHGFNLWIQASIWDFVLLLGSDDYLYDDILKKVNHFINTVHSFGYLDVTLCNFFCDSINYWSDTHTFLQRKPQTEEFTIKQLIRYGNISGFQNIYMNRKWFENYSINVKNKYSMDYESYFNMLQAWQIFIHIPEINSINCLGQNTTCRYWYESQKEANGISFQHASNLIDYLFVFRRFLLREILHFSKSLWIIK